MFANAFRTSLAFVTAALTRRWRKKVGSIPDAESVTFRSEIHGAGNPVEIHLSLDDHEQLIAAADALKVELQQYPGVFDVSDSFLPGKKEMQLKLKPAARSLGCWLGCDKVEQSATVAAAAMNSEIESRRYGTSQSSPAFSSAISHTP